MEDIVLDKSLVSIIVPVYNVKPFLSLCLEAIRLQTYSKLQVLIIDDGSTDGSEKICDLYASADSRFHVWHTSNHGVSKARNMGLDNATGEYILYVDPDDVPDATLVERCVDAIDLNECDLVMFQFDYIDENGMPCEGYYSNEEQNTSEDILNVQQALSKVLLGIIHSFPWGFMARRKLYEYPMPIRFPEGRVIEDTATTYRLINRTRRVLRIPDVLYFYRVRKTSITNISDKSEMFYLSHILNAKEQCDFVRSGVNLDEETIQKTQCLCCESAIASYYGLMQKRVLSVAGKKTANQCLNAIFVSDVLNRIPWRTRILWYANKFHLAKFIAMFELLVLNKRR